VADAVVINSAAANNPKDFIALGRKKLRPRRAILTGAAGDKGALAHTAVFAASMR
jgi:putative sterol carrier protein